MVSSLAAQELTPRHRVGYVTDVSTPQPQSQVFNPSQLEDLYSQKQSLSDIKDHMTSIDKSIASIETDVRDLRDTTSVVKFLSHCVEILIPGVFIAMFGIWFAEYLKKKNRKGSRNSTASA
jgi:hypothetical protein